MIPRLGWWDVSRLNAFGPYYTDRVYFNHTQEELWPVNITNAIFPDVGRCSDFNNATEYCVVAGAAVIGLWIGLQQNQGSKPNITIFHDGEVARYLTFQGGPPDTSSWVRRRIFYLS